MYRLYLDEIGTDDLVDLNNDNHRYLSLTGIIVHTDQVRQVLAPRMAQLKAECFIFDPDEDKICLHRHDIVHRRKIFHQLNNDAIRQKFDLAIFSLMRDLDYKVITVVVDKLEMSRRSHWQQQHPYHFLMEVIVEKFCQFLKRTDDIGDIWPEARKGKKDEALQSEYLSIWENGTRFIDASDVQSRLRAKNLKFRTKRDMIPGLELCDLIAHPSHIYVRSQRRHPVSLGPFA